MTHLTWRHAACVAVLGVALAACSSSDDTAQKPSGTSSVTESGHSEIQLAWLEKQAEAFNQTDPPTIKMVRTVTMQENDSAHFQCLQELGWSDLTKNPVGGFAAPQMSDERIADLDRDRYRCTAMYPVSDAAAKPLDRDSHTRDYEYYTQKLVPCLEKEGYPQTEEVPSLEAYISGRESGESTWFPYKAVDPSTSSEQWAMLTEKCPELPDY